MRRFYQEKVHPYLLNVTLVLFILQVLLLPLALSYAYAGKSEAPAHELTYSAGSLAWDSATGIRPDGSAELKVFSDDKIAPGMEGGCNIRLKNASAGTVQYTAVLYRLRTDDSLPLDAELSAEGAESTAATLLPKGIAPEDVVETLGGSLAGNAMKDFSIRWHWDYSADAQQDALDTRLGSEGKHTATLGVYLIAEDDNGTLTPEPPKAGDDSLLTVYLVLMLVCGSLLIFLMAERRRNREQ